MVAVRLVAVAVLAAVVGVGGAVDEAFALGGGDGCVVLLDIDGKGATPIETGAPDEVCGDPIPGSVGSGAALTCTKVIDIPGRGGRPIEIGAPEEVCANLP